jgi:hypothetical protein
LGCKRIKCDVCRRRRAYVWQQHARKLFAPFEAINVITAQSPKEAARIVKLLSAKNRHGKPAATNQDGQYLRIQPVAGGATTFFIATPIPDSVSRPAVEAVQLFDTLTNSIGRPASLVGRNRPVNAGRRWKLPKTASKEWVREVVIKDRNLDRLERSLRARKLRPRRLHLEATDVLAVGWEFGRDWSEADQAAVMLALSEESEADDYPTEGDVVLVPKDSAINHRVTNSGAGQAVVMPPAGVHPVFHDSDGRPCGPSESTYWTWPGAKKWFSTADHPIQFGVRGMRSNE